MRTDFKNPVAQTCCWIAAARHAESQRPDRLFNDPYAQHLCGGVELPELGSDAVTYLALRTRYLDDLCQAAIQSGIRQVVDVAAGMDARAYRLNWPQGTVFFELDRPEVLSEKNGCLARLRADPACDRRTAGVDLTADWPGALLELGFDPNKPTLWLVEGLLMYLDPSAVDTLLHKISRLSATGSRLGGDVAGARIEDPDLREETMARFGFYWRFGTGDPAPWFERHGWQVTVGDPQELGQHLGRSYQGKDVLEGCFVQATKR